MEKWKKELEYNYSILDKIDILPYLKPGFELFNIMDRIEEDNKPLASNNKLKGDLFCFMDAEDFKDYLKKRYPGIYFRTYIEIYVGGFRSEA